MWKLGAVAAVSTIVVGCSAGHPTAGAAPTSTSRAVTTAAPTTTTSTTVTPKTTATTVAPAGPPYRVATMTVAIVDTSRPTVSHGRTISSTRALSTVVWYPQAPGRHPLVVFGPGYDVGPSTYEALLTSWAAHGYVVAAIRFPLADPEVAGANLDEYDINNQPQDMRFVADFLVGRSSPIAALVDSREVAAAGHSDGAETAVAAVEDPVPAGEPPFRALVAMSAQSVPGRDGPYPPMLVTQGDDDAINPPSLGYQLYDSARPPKYMLILRGGGHLPPVQGGSPWLPGIEAVTEAFLDTYLSGSGAPSRIVSAASGYANMSLQSST
jgi:hypothetical protein